MHMSGWWMSGYRNGSCQRKKKAVYQIWKRYGCPLHSSLFHYHLHYHFISICPIIPFSHYPSPVHPSNHLQFISSISCIALTYHSTPNLWLFSELVNVSTSVTTTKQTISQFLFKCTSLLSLSSHHTLPPLLNLSIIIT